MAEIRVEKKKGVPVWAILAALIVLALIVWAISSLRNRGHQQAIDHTALAEPAQILILEVHQILIPSARCG